MADIFISYVRSDRPQAERLANALRSPDWTIWWDTTLLAGEPFERVITEQLQAAKCVIVLWSAASVVSDWVRDEATEAKRRRVFVPCLVEPVRPPMGFRQYHAEDLSSWDGETNDENFQALKRAIAKHVPGLSSSPSAAAPVPRRIHARALDRSLRYLMAFSVVFLIGVTPLLGTLNAPGFSGMASVFPLNLGQALIPFASFAMAVQVVAMQWFCRWKQFSRRALARWLVGASVATATMALFLFATYSYSVVHVTFAGGDRTAAYIVGDEFAPECPCIERKLPIASCIGRGISFDPVEVTDCYPRNAINGRRFILAMLYIAMTLGFGTLIGLVLAGQSPVPSPLGDEAAVGRGD